MDFSSWVSQWLMVWCAQKRPKTIESYQNTFDRHVLPIIGAVPLDQLEPEHIQMVINAIMANDYERTAQLAYTLMSACLKRAVRSRKAPSNPCADVDKPKHITKPARALEVGEDEAFRLSGQSDRYWPAFALMLYAGLRRGEVIALQWRDVDLQHAKIFVNRNSVMVHGKACIGPPKSAAGVRTIPICASLRDVLRVQREECLKRALAAPDCLVAPGQSGEPLSPSCIRNHLVRIAARSGLPYVSAHGLRHTFGTRCYQRGLSIKSLQYIMGHSNPDLTLRLYVHGQLTHIISEFASSCSSM